MLFCLTCIYWSAESDSLSYRQCWWHYRSLQERADCRGLQPERASFNAGGYKCTFVLTLFEVTFDDLWDKMFALLLPLHAKYLNTDVSTYAMTKMKSWSKRWAPVQLNCKCLHWRKYVLHPRCFLQTPEHFSETLCFGEEYCNVS